MTSWIHFNVITLYETEQSNLVKHNSLSGTINFLMKEDTHCQCTEEKDTIFETVNNVGDCLAVLNLREQKRKNDTRKQFQPCCLISLKCPKRDGDTW